MCETGVRCEEGQKRVRLFDRSLNRTQFENIFQNAHVLNTYYQSIVIGGYFYIIYQKLSVQEAHIRVMCIMFLDHDYWCINVSV